MKKINLFIVALFFALFASSQATSTFDTLTLGVDTFWNGSDMAGGFSDGHAYFENQYDTASGGYWGGFSYSDKTDSVTQGYLNQYSAITAGGFNGSKNYAVAYDAGYGNVVVRLTQNALHRAVEGFYVTNTTYTYKDMLNGDNFGNLPFTPDSSDFLLLHITGWKSGIPVGDTVNFYLANYTFPDTTKNYIVKTWQWVNLLALGNVDSLVFSITGSRNDSYGLETPSYFAMDNFITADLPVTYDTILYNQDTLLNVLANVVDTTGGPFTVEVVSRTIPGSTVVDSLNEIWYFPQDGVVGFDTVVYAICNAANQCDTSEIIVDVLSPTGIRRINALQTKVYPNPCGNSFSVYHTGDVKTVELFDMEGRLIRSIPCNAGELVTGVETADLSAGTYIVKAISDQGIGISKVIKQ
jgi:hypothetical protein